MTAIHGITEAAKAVAELLRRRSNLPWAIHGITEAAKAVAGHSRPARQCSTVEQKHHFCHFKGSGAALKITTAAQVLPFLFFRIRKCKHFPDANRSYFKP